MASSLIVTKAEFARRLGRSPGRISQMIASGILRAPALRSDGRIELQLALDMVAPHLADVDLAAVDMSAPAPRLSPLAQAREQREVALAEAATLNLGRLRGELVALEGVRLAGLELGAELGRMLTDRAPSVAAAARAAATAGDAAKAVAAADRKLLAELAERLERIVAELAPSGSAAA